MTKIIHLASEDELSEAVGLKLISEIPGFESGLKFRDGGNSYLKASLGKFCELAKREPLLLLTDQDRATCAPTLIKKWVGTLTLPKPLMFRVAGREIESWLLADHEAMKKLMGASIAGKLPKNPDDLLDPKSELLNLARRAPAVIRNALVIQDGTVASQGIGYNSVLSEFVRTTWSPSLAEQRSDSLKRARLRLSQLST